MIWGLKEKKSPKPEDFGEGCSVSARALPDAAGRGAEEDGDAWDEDVWADEDGLTSLEADEAERSPAVFFDCWGVEGCAIIKDLLNGLNGLLQP